MATSAMTVRLDADTKKRFDTLCQEFGMSSNTAVNIFVNQVVRTKSIPFTISSEDPKTEIVRERAIAALRSAHERAVNSPGRELTLDEINQEIKEVRRLRREREMAEQRKGA